MKKKINVWISSEAFDKLHKQAALEEKSLSALVNSAIHVSLGIQESAASQVEDDVADLRQRVAKLERIVKRLDTY